MYLNVILVRKIIKKCSKMYIIGKYVYNLSYTFAQHKKCIYTAFKDFTPHFQRFYPRHWKTFHRYISDNLCHFATVAFFRKVQRLLRLFFLATDHKLPNNHPQKRNRPKTILATLSSFANANASLNERKPFEMYL